MWQRVSGATLTEAIALAKRIHVWVPFTFSGGPIERRGLWLEITRTQAEKIAREADTRRVTVHAQWDGTALDIGGVAVLS